MISQYFDRARQINFQPEYTNNTFTGLSEKKKTENLLKIQEADKENEGTTKESKVCHKIL